MNQEMETVDSKEHFRFIHEHVKKIWDEISSLIEKAWQILGFDSYVYRDNDDKDEDYAE